MAEQTMPLLRGAEEVLIAAEKYCVPKLPLPRRVRNSEGLGKRVR